MPAFDPLDPSTWPDGEPVKLSDEEVDVRGTIRKFDSDEQRDEFVSKLRDQGYVNLEEFLESDEAKQSTNDRIDVPLTSMTVHQFYAGLAMHAIISSPSEMTRITLQADSEDTKMENILGQAAQAAARAVLRAEKKAKDRRSEQLEKIAQALKGMMESGELDEMLKSDNDAPVH